MSVNVQPIGDRVLVQEIEIKEEKIGSIYIPDTAKEKPQQGAVVAVGDDEELNKKLKVGDTVIYAKYGGTEIKIKGEKYIILKLDDVLAKINA